MIVMACSNDITILVEGEEKKQKINKLGIATFLAIPAIISAIILGRGKRE